MTLETHHYPILIAGGLLSDPQAWLSANANIVIITDNHVKEKYGLGLVKTLQKNDLEPLLLSFLPGEASKCYATKQALEEQMLLQHCDRNTLILALGGGVVGDMAGFIAATYMRGIPYIQIPTTLLAMVDSSIGGKTGINTAQGKNVIGAFWQPQAVVADLQCLTSLPREQLVNGLIEAMKMFLTHDEDSFHQSDAQLDTLLRLDIPALKKLTQQAIHIKMTIVDRDEKENNERMVLNFGHTIGHAIEQLSHYHLLHGHAVALGILVEAKISQYLGLLSAEAYKIIQRFFSRLPISGNTLKQFPPDAIMQATRIDKKAAAGEVRYVLLEKIGKVHQTDGRFAHPVKDDLVRKAIHEVCHDGE